MGRHPHHTMRVLLCFTMLIIAGLYIPVSQAQEPGHHDEPGSEDFIGSELLPVSGENAIRSYQALIAQSQTPAAAILIVELAESPATGISGAFDQAPAAARSQIARVESAQRGVLGAMSAAGLDYTVIFSPKRVFSGLIIEADRSQIDTIKQIPGVADVYPAGIGVLQTATSVPFISAPVVWASGYTGQGVSIGIIDTGIDYRHADFGGTGPGTAFPNAKVAGGYDFVGDTWHPVTDPVLRPDSDPMDQQNHGTWVAGIAAGFGVTSTGNTYTGPWNDTTPFSTMLIGPGVAPEATLYALKVGATGGFVSEAGVIAALEWAVDPNGDGDLSDHLDVVNMSIGNTFGEPDQGWSVASNNAAQAGVIVVAAATNIGDVYFSQGDPATADRAISVAGSRDTIGAGLADMLYSSTARGPQRGPDPAQLALKPDITAPGESVTSARRNTISGSITSSGTSAASPHVAGVMALLRERYPGWSVAQLKALVMNTATHNLYSSANLTPPIYGPARIGAGRLEAANAFNSDVIAYNAAAPYLVSVSFGVLNVASETTFHKNITVENRGSSTLTYDVAYAPVAHADDGNDAAATTPGIGDGGPGVVMSVSPASITLGPGETRNLDVTLYVNPALMTRPYSHDATVSEVYLVYYRHWLAEESGYVTLTPTAPGPGSIPLRIPVYAAPRPSSTMQSTVSVLPVTEVTGSASIPLAGTGVNTGPQLPYDETSLVSAFELTGEDDNDAAPIGGFDAGDIQYVGVANTYRQSGNRLPYTQLNFGIATYGEWSSLAKEIRFDVYIDPNQDGTADYRVWNGSLTGDLFNSIPSDDLFVFLDDLNIAGTTVDDLEDLVNYYTPANINPPFPNTVIFQNNVVFLPFYVSTVSAFTPGNTTFDYWVAAIYQGQLVDVTDVMTYTIESQGIDLASGATRWGASLYDDQDGATIDLNYDWSQYTGANPPCILLLHHHNIPALRTEIVCLQPDLVYDLAIMKSVSNSTPNPRESITYLITVTNQGTTPAPVVIVEDRLPDGVTYVSHTASQGDYTPASGQWTVGALAAGASAILQIEVVVNPNAHGVITNTALVRPGAGGDRTPANNIASVDIRLGGGGAGGAGGEETFSPVINKQAALAPGALGVPGDQIIWTITVTNAGTLPGYDFQVTDTIRPELRVDRAETARGTVSIDRQTVTWTIDHIDPGESVLLHIDTTILDIPPEGLFINEAVLFSPQGTSSAAAQVAGVESLPATGYPPQKSARLEHWVPIGLVGLLLMGIMLAVVRRSRLV